MSIGNGDGDSDTRVVYGAMCTYWGPIRTVKIHPHGGGLPCCPWCNGMLFEMETEDIFLDGARQYEAAGHAGYTEFILWLKGRECYPVRGGMIKAAVTYAAATGKSVVLT